MAPKESRDKDQIGRVGEAGLVLVSDLAPSSPDESYLV